MFCANRRTVLNMADEGRTIRAMREAMGLSVRELARRADVSPAYLSLVENDKRQPTSRWLQTVKHALAAEMIRASA